MDTTLLVGLVDADHIKQIADSAQRYARFSKLKTEILEVSDTAITVKIEQVEKMTDKVFTGKELNAKAKDIFKSIVDDFQIRVRPLTFKGTGIDAVSGKWVKSQLKKNGLKQKDLVNDFNIDRVAMSKVLNNGYAMTRWHRAAFYFYFENIKNKSK